MTCNTTKGADKGLRFLQPTENHPTHISGEEGEADWSLATAAAVLVGVAGAEAPCPWILKDGEAGREK
jgi:hypothetical protein